jgi:4-diphosphocytidyl-2-C-methyl-D-erythritol kinase
VLRYHAHGKINLYLDVLDRRADGFTNIETLFQTLSLHDVLTFQARAAGIELTCDHPDVGPPEKNLAYRAAALLQAHTGCTQGVAIHIAKRIPVAGGMAGGSTDAAAALVACNRLWDLGLDTPQLCALALDLGSDVPYCVLGGTAAATGRGEELTPLPTAPAAWFVLVHPPLLVSAGYVYGHPQLTRSAEQPVQGRTPAFTRALESLAHGDLPAVIFNRMESAVFHDHPELAETCARLRALGCPAAAMSGSGPTLFGLCHDEAHAREVQAGLTGQHTSIAHTVNAGIVAVA